MSMNPTDFHDLLDSAVADVPLADRHEADVAAGRRRLRRRTWAVTAGAAALVAVTTVGAVSAVSGPDAGRGTDSPPLVAQAPTSDADLLDSCRHGNQGPVATAAIFDSGTPTVKAVSRNSHQVILAIESADGQHWAECFIHLESAEFASGMTVYDATGRSTGTSYSSGGGCGLVDGDIDRTCTAFVVSWVDRLPSAVAAVRFDLYDGMSPTVQTDDGYVVLNHRGEDPEGRFDVTDMPQPINRVTYLDATGQPIAAEDFDGSGSGPDRDQVDDLPRLSAFPSLRRDDTVVRETS
jgi:hypothetical protein